jgi:membrane fusion protein, multidrug efflux system
MMMGGFSFPHLRDQSQIANNKFQDRDLGFVIWKLSLALVGVICIAGCEPSKPVKLAKNPRVIVTKPITDKVMDYQDFTGRLEAVEAVEIRARVSGYVIEAIEARDKKPNASGVKEIKVKEGDFVKEGELLFKIEEKPYKVEFDQMEANLNLAKAEKNLMTKKAERARRLKAAQAMSPEDYETAMAEYEKSVAQVGSVEAMKAKAQMYLDYTRVKAPVSGRISRRFADPGNLITADNTVLTTIVTEDRMYAYFDVDERTYLGLLTAIAPGRKSWHEGLNLPVMMRLAHEDDFTTVGAVDFVDNRVVANTGTVRMRGVFKNPTGILKAGLFVRIRLPISDAYNAILIPDEAIQSDQERKYVWVVNAKNDAEYRSVNLGQSIKGGTAEDPVLLRVLKKDQKGKEVLSQYERVIINGMQRVRNGFPVDAEDKPPPSPPEMPLVQMLKKGRSP